MTEPMTAAAVQEALAEPFHPDDLGYKPGKVSGNRAMVLTYIDARNVQERLDRVLGIANWRDEYVPLEHGNVLCKLSVRVDGEWITKEDVGGESDQPDASDRCKAAVSDALKRAAVKMGIGRYLYNLGSEWMEYDQQKKQLARIPRLPDWALPYAMQKQRKPVPPAPPQPRQEPPAEQQPAKAPAAPKKAAPRNGLELLKRLARYEEWLVREGLCSSGDLINHVMRAGTTAGHPPKMGEWSAKACEVAPDAVRSFEAKVRADAERQAPILAELRRRFDEATPGQLMLLERDVMVADIKQADRDDLVRAVRVKMEEGKAGTKTSKAKSGG